jgi:hypothetical protein
MRFAQIPILVVLVAIAGATAQAASLARDRDPVVITGEPVQALWGWPIGEIVAFRYEGGWQQIPVQVDERTMVDFATVYDQPPVGLLTTAYADSTTYTGPDDDPAFDDNDELVFMAADAGDPAPGGAGAPAHVMPGSGLEISITDPLDGGQGYAYLFRSDGSLSPDAGQDYVTYDFNLLAGDYIPDYSLEAGPNPEDSAAWSSYYRTHFSDRWIRDQVNVFAGGASAVDVLDRHKVMLSPGNCGRTEDTFSAGEGAFFANLDGPVRAIRSYMGANSGPLTQRDHLFYRQRQDVVTYLRVHGGIPGVMDLYDYSPNATGMSYSNDLNLFGVPVDGQPDVVTTGVLAWEMVTGAQGTLVMSLVMETDIDPLNLTSFYSDDQTPSYTQCTGDAYEYATSGPWVDQVMPNTDPYLGPHNNLTGLRVIYYEPPDQTTATAALRHSQATTALAVAVQPYGAVPGDYDGDGDVDLDDFAHWPDCMTGPGQTFEEPACGTFDFDADAEVDLADFAGFEEAFAPS